jgi:hypothetical protein
MAEGAGVGAAIRRFGSALRCLLVGRFCGQGAMTGTPTRWGFVCNRCTQHLRQTGTECRVHLQDKPCTQYPHGQAKPTTFSLFCYIPIHVIYKSNSISWSCQIGTVSDPAMKSRNAQRVCVTGKRKGRDKHTRSKSSGNETDDVRRSTAITRRASATVGLIEDGSAAMYEESRPNRVSRETGYCLRSCFSVSNSSPKNHCKYFLVM